MGKEGGKKPEQPIFFKKKLNIITFQPLDPPSGCDNATQRTGHEEPGRDPVGARDHQPGHAERPRRGHRPVGGQGEEDTGTR